jgi:mannose-6-phosphate isomerase-like protein (cupin superfamily)
MLIKKGSIDKKQNSQDCTVWEYEYPSNNFSFATALINGRYPEKNKAVNNGCEGAYYIISGSGMIYSEKGEFLVSQGDLYYFEKGEKYWVSGVDLFVGIINAPRWTSEQYEIVE